MLSQRGRYALKAMLDLARVPHRQPRQVSGIAADENIPRKFLEAIMSELRQAGLVESVRGKLGGYRLVRPAGLITFGEIMRITDGPLALLPCVSHKFYRRCDDCLDERACALRRVMAVVRREVSDVLDRTTLADAIDGAVPDLRELVQEPAVLGPDEHNQ
jgi:Rrf2 family protein